VETEAVGTFQAVHGFVEHRRGGGANTIALMQRDPIYACKVCVRLQRQGINVEQGVLW